MSSGLYLNVEEFIVFDIELDSRAMYVIDKGCYRSSFHWKSWNGCKQALMNDVLYLLVHLRPIQVPFITITQKHIKETKIALIMRK
jgi:hypothetical protein